MVFVAKILSSHKLKTSFQQVPSYYKCCLVLTHQLRCYVWLWLTESTRFRYSTVEQDKKNCTKISFNNYEFLGLENFHRSTYLNLNTRIAYNENLKNRRLFRARLRDRKKIQIDLCRINSRIWLKQGLKSKLLS
jgi:hypothetical protein